MKLTPAQQKIVGYCVPNHNEIHPTGKEVSDKLTFRI
jgi:hypothetical protein